MIMDGHERRVSEQVRDGEKPGELLEKRSDGDVERESSETDNMSYSP